MGVEVAEIDANKVDDKEEDHTSTTAAANASVGHLNKGRRHSK